MKHILILFFISNILSAQTFIDTVYSYKWGTGSQVVGRSEKYFPQNIFGSPTSYATKYNPAQHDSNVVSLGLGGEIIVGLKNGYIINKEGPDFIIFENVFSNHAGTKIFVEPAIVSVSVDGINFVEFPYNPATLEGLAGINWTNGNANCFDYKVSGGDAFDLDDVGMDSVRFIKIKDTALIASTLPTNHIYYNPAGLLTGFDLDAVVILHSSEKSADNDLLFVSNIDGNYHLTYKQNTEISMFDVLGCKIELKNKHIIHRYDYTPGIYFIRAERNDKVNIVKMIFY